MKIKKTWVEGSKCANPSSVRKLKKIKLPQKKTNKQKKIVEFTLEKNSKFFTFLGS
jgi:transposase